MLIGEAYISKWVFVVDYTELVLFLAKNPLRYMIISAGFSKKRSIQSGKFFGKSGHEESFLGSVH